MFSVVFLFRSFRPGIYTNTVSWNCAYHYRLDLSDCGFFPNFVRNYRLTTVTRQSLLLTIYIHTYIHIYIYVCMCVCVCVYTNTPWDSKTNRIKFIFPQDGFSVPIKVFHFLNAPPICHIFFSLFKRVFYPKFAAKISDFNGLHFRLILSLTISIIIRYFHWKCNIIIIIVIIFFFFFFIHYSPWHELYNKMLQMKFIQIWPMHNMFREVFHHSSGTHNTVSTLTVS